MSKIKELFFPRAVEENRSVSKEELYKFLNYLNSSGDEGTQFDAKDFGKILDTRNLINTDKTKVELGKHVSAFANTSGGLLAIGIRENKESEIRFAFNPYQIDAIDQQQIQRALSMSVEPPPNYHIEVIELGIEEGKAVGVILIFIEQSQHPPHQLIYNRTYYFRHGDMSYPAPHSLVLALFSGRKGPKLEVDLIKHGQPPKLRMLIKNKGNAPAMHAQIIINIFPRLMRNSKILFTKRHIEKTTDGLWMVKAFLGSEQKNFMKFRFRASPGQIILPHVNEILFDLPFEEYPGSRLNADIYCEGHEYHQEFDLD